MKLRELKARGQLLEPVVRVGKLGLTPAVLAETERALTDHELIKIRLDHERNMRAELAGKIAEVTGAAVVMQVGKVAVFYRPKPATTPPAVSD